jgi:hypothetical protein
MADKPNILNLRLAARRRLLMRRTITGLCLLAGLTLAAGGCSGQHWGPMTWTGPSAMYRRVPVGTIRLGSAVPPRSVALARVAAGDLAWHVAGASRPWRYVVIHHSATAGGNAELFDASHRRDRGWDELGYHFVIDNGRGGPDGRVEVGSRWSKQKHGAHCGGTPNNEYNELGIGICLVGDFNRRLPSSPQLASLDRLVAYLAETYDIRPENVITHRDAPGANTECPGGLFHAYVHGRFKEMLRLKLAATCPAWRRRAG